MSGLLYYSACHVTAAIVAAHGVTSAYAQPEAAVRRAPESTARPIAGFDGKTFAGVNLPAQPQEGVVRLSGARAWAWQEGQTNRLLVERDVRVTIGLYQFAARRAVVWIEPVRVAGRDADQVAVYLEGVTSVPGAAPIEQAGDRLLVTGLIVGGALSLKTDLLERSRPDDPLVREGEARLAEYLMQVSGGPAREIESVPRPLSSIPDRDQIPGEAPGAQWVPADDRVDLPAAPPPTIRFADEGIVAPSAERIEFVAPTPELAGRVGAGGAIILSGGVSVTYSRPGDVEAGEGAALRTVELTAQRAVVFLSGDADAGRARYSIGQIQGVYLEGDVVASSGTYTLRGARMYYDIGSERAIVLDAVFWTFDADRGMPLYLRADAIRQESRSQWSASNVRMANVGFAKPHFAIGATDVTLTMVPANDETGEPERQVIDATGVKFLAGNLPLTFAPRVKGEFRASPLRRLDVDSEGGDPIIRTGWDIYTLAGLDPAPGNSATLLLDGYFDRGPAAGLDIEWSAADINGALFAYYIYDDGTDRLPSGDRLDQDEEHRGMAQVEQVWRLSENWTLFTEFSYISDETFLPAFFRTESETHREYVNSLYARYLDDQSMLSFEVRGTINDFVPNQYLLQSQGYQVQKYPEVAYYRVGDELFGGVLRYTGESRFSMMSLSFTEPTVEELGWRTPSKAEAAFGLAPGQSIGDALRAQGLNEDGVARFDTRHELEAPLTAGPVNLVPFVVGRLTSWDTNFEDFSGDSDQDRTRLWGSVGVRFGTSIQRVYDGVESQALDLHRLRHIIEPNGTIWFADTNVEQQDLPVYDDDVESLAKGFSTRLGVRNTLQTQRGGEGQWRSVDWLVVDTNFIFSSDEGPSESPFGRFIDARPELSNLGDYVANDVLFQFTDALAVTSGIIYSFDDDQLQRTTVGLVIDHGPGFSTFVEYRDLHPLGETYLDVGVKYELTRKYEAAVVGVYDTDERDFQTIGVRVARRFPQWTVDVSFGYDNISDDVSMGFSLRPAGLSNDRRTRVLTRDLEDDMVFRAITPQRDRLEFGPFADRP